MKRIKKKKIDQILKVTTNKKRDLRRICKKEIDKYKNKPRIKKKRKLSSNIRKQ